MGASRRAARWRGIAITKSGNIRNPLTNSENGTLIASPSEKKFSLARFLNLPAPLV